MNIEKATSKAFNATQGTRLYAYDDGFFNHSRSSRKRAKRTHAKALRRVNKALCMDLTG